MSLYARLAALILIVLAAAGAWWKFDRMLDAADRAGYERRVGEDKAVADKQAENNREMQRSAEKNYVVTREGQDHYFVTTVKEIHEAAAPLASCPVPDAVRLRLNAAAACARGDPAATCEPADEVPDTR